MVAKGGAMLPKRLEGTKPGDWLQQTELASGPCEHARAGFNGGRGEMTAKNLVDSEEPRGKAAAFF